MGARKLEPKACKAKGCGKKFSPYNSLEKACSVECAIAIGKEAVEKKQRQEKQKHKRERRQLKENNRGWALARCQEAFNALIRFQDRDLPCVTCGTTKPDIQYCCGHWKTRGAHPEWRFRRENVARQCNQLCNLHNSGRPLEFRPLIELPHLRACECLRSCCPPDPSRLPVISRHLANVLCFLLAVSLSPALDCLFYLLRRMRHDQIPCITVNSVPVPVFPVHAAN